MRCMDHALTEMSRLAGFVPLLVQLLLPRTQQLLRPAAGTAAAARTFVPPDKNII